MRAKPNAPRIALALAGGGPLGAIYEIGALCALEESLDGLDFNRLQHYVGVSAGAFIAAALANGMTPRQLCASFIEASGEPSDIFHPAWLLAPAYGEFAHRAAMLPGLLGSALWHTIAGRRSLAHALERLGRGIPTGLFSNAPADQHLAKAFSRAGRTNDFRQLATKLTLVAVNLDSGEAAPFGRPGWDHVPISKAVQASAALPGLFPPVEIDGQHFVDGVLKKTLHASIALEDGADLLLCLNPLVPFNAKRQTATSEGRATPRIAQGGLPAVLSQTFRAMIHSRLELGMKHYERAYPASDIVLIEPDQGDAEMHLANTFSYSRREQLAEHAYQQTRALLRSRRGGLARTLQRHGIGLRLDLLDDMQRRLIPARPSPTRLGRAVTSLHKTLDDLVRVLKAA